MALLTARAGGPWLGAASLPPDVHRIVTALSPLPPAVEVSTTPLTPGTRCVNMPLWGNLLLPNAPPTGRRPGLEVYRLVPAAVD